MWVLAEYEVGDEELRRMTTSVWTVPGSGVFVGVMRPLAFGPPVLWLRAERLSMWHLRQWRKAMAALHDVLHEPALFAECRDDVGRRFLSFLGFEEFYSSDGVTFHQRSE